MKPRPIFSSRSSRPRRKHSGLGLATTLRHRPSKRWSYSDRERARQRNHGAALFAQSRAAAAPLQEIEDQKNCRPAPRRFSCSKTTLAFGTFPCGCCVSSAYTVLEAANGDDAQTDDRGKRRHGKSICFSTDVVMPPHERPVFFADWLRKISPKTKVVFVSGYLGRFAPARRPDRQRHVSSCQSHLTPNNSPPPSGKRWTRR